MSERIRWGIIGTGQMAHKFADGLDGVEDAELIAVTSRSLEGARVFATEFRGIRACESYEQLANLHDIDVIYIATPITEHLENMLLCLEHGKSVLCEKAFTVNARQAKHAVAIAKRNGLFLMEAMWMRYLPAMCKVREWLQNNALGSIRLITGDLGFDMAYDPNSLLFNPSLAGGALLSVGVYAVSFASMVFGDLPIRVHTVGYLGKTGVDEQFTISLEYSEGRFAAFTVSIRTKMSQQGHIYGEKGFIYLPKFFAPHSVELWLNGSKPEIYTPEFRCNGYNYEAEEVCHCLRQGKRESKVMPLAETVAVMTIMDEVRSAWKLLYPCEITN